MSAGTVQWSTTAIVSTNDWGVLVYDENGAHQLKGTRLDAPVAWLRSRLEAPVPVGEVIKPLAPPAQTRMRRLLEALAACGAVTVEAAAPVSPGALTVRLTHDGHPIAAALTDQLSTRLQAAGARCVVGTTAEQTGAVCVDGTLHHGADPTAFTGFRVVAAGQELWLGLFSGSEAHRRTAAAELVRHLVRAGAAAAADLADAPWEAWVPWLTQTVLDASVKEAPQDRCVRLGWDPYGLDEHRLVLEDSASVGRAGSLPAASQQLEEDLGDPLVLSRRCAGLVDDITSPLGVPSESGLLQLPLQLSCCRVRLANESVRAVPGHGWTLEEARGRAVGAAVLEHSISCLAPELTAHQFRDHPASGPSDPVHLLRTNIDLWLAQGRGVASLGTTDADSARSAAARLAAHLVLEEGLSSWRAPVALPPTIPGADLLALYQDRAELLVATGLPFALAAVPVAPGVVVAGISAHDEQEAVREAVIQALLHHQCQDPGNEAAAPRTWARPHSGASTSLPTVIPDLNAVLNSHGLPVVIPLSSGPDLDAALPHRSLVLLIPGGS